MRKVSVPAVSILDRRFVYVPSYRTDLAETFRRVRKEMKRAKGKK